jgi:HTH-type transcriptional regulator/antitoxin HigA
MSLATAVSKKYQTAYLKLVRKFPLRPIRSDAELDEAIRIIDSLVDQPHLEPAAADYLEVLGDLVERFETENRTFEPLPDAKMLQFLIESKDVTQSAVAEATGIANSTISEVLKGKRRLTRAHIQSLAAYFKVGTGVFSLPD